MAFQVFLSYAHNDDLPPLEGKGYGFVTTLLEHLDYRFKQFGPPKPHIWRDARKLSRSDQFDPVIEKAIEGSDLFMVVLSNNWMHSDYCNNELDAFLKHADASSIVLVVKHEIADDDRPKRLGRQDGYRFYHPAEEEMYEDEYFCDGEASKEFNALAKDLARDLWRRTKQHEGDEEKPTAPPAPPASPNGRKIYLAKPAGDMAQAYARVAAELEKSGYAVTPAADAEIPRDASAREFIESEMKTSEASVHLLGERAGYAPEDCDPIVKMQLVSAAARAVDDPAFRRVIWAPRLYQEQVRADAPFGVLERFDKSMPADQIEGNELSAFCEFLIQHLDKTAPQTVGSEPAAAGDGAPEGMVYVYSETQDRLYARKVVKALQARDVDAQLGGVFQGDPVKSRLLDAQKLRECKAVVLCWAKATEVDVKAKSCELSDSNWRQLGRDSKFAVRGLVAGPPLDEPKEELLDIPPRSEIDIVLDLTNHEEPSSEDLEPIIKLIRSCQAT